MHFYELICFDFRYQIEKKKRIQKLKKKIKLKSNFYLNFYLIFTYFYQLYHLLEIIDRIFNTKKALKF